VNNLLNDLDSHISEEDNNVSEGDAGSDFLKSFENENNYFDKNQIMANNNNIPRDSEKPKIMHHLPRESSKRGFFSYLRHNFLKRKDQKDEIRGH